MNINDTEYYELKAYVHNVIQSTTNYIKMSKGINTSFTNGRALAYEDALQDLEEINRMLIELEEK